MADKNMQDINIDEVMERIREEVARRKATASTVIPVQSKVSPDALSPTLSETKLWRILKKIQDKLHKFAFYSLIRGFALSIKKYIPKYKSGFTLEDFSNHHDESFIRYAYLGILEREPDSQGSNTYLTSLRRGDLSKTEILGRLRYSCEGRKKRVQIRGLLPRFSVLTTFRIPIVGYLINLLISVMRLPIILKNTRAYETSAAARFTQQDSNTNKLSADFAAHLSVVDQKLSAKADAQVVDQKLSAKADAQVVNNQIQSVNEEIITILSQIRDHKLNILEQQRRLSILLEEARMWPVESISGSVERSEIMLKEKNHILDAMYVAFEDRFRGTREDIKNRLKVYLPYIERVIRAIGNGTVLDVGCGRGEWMELLSEISFVAKGVDLNRVMVHECEERGFDVTEADAIEYLRNQPSNSLSAVTGFHIIEHLPFHLVISLLDESFRVLKTGGVIILETPNPENLLVGTCNFYTDPTHKTPYPPEPLKFFVEQRGFSEIEILKLHKVKNVDSTGKDIIDEIVHRYNVEQDYAVIGYKA